MDVPVAVDNVLSQPTRARLFAALSERRGPAGTEELAALLDLHPNGVRMHLERLREAGLVARERPRQARGRPRDMWSVAPGARPGGEPPRAYADLGRWLTRVLAGGKAGLRAVETTGRAIGRDLVPDDDGAQPPAERMQTLLASMGFQPERSVTPSGAVRFELCNCPYREAVHEDQNVVCTLHRGITAGVLEALEPDSELAAFVPKDPDAAGCVIEVRGDMRPER